MILVKSKLAPSKIHGTGLFATEDVKKDTLVWIFDKKFDLVLSGAELLALSEAAREQFLNYAYISKLTGNYILCSDDSRFFNHTRNPNVTCYIPDERESDDDLACVANKDIMTGEELTCDYSEFDLDPSDVIASNI
jgi:uncharacterized protein